MIDLATSHRGHKVLLLVGDPSIAARLRKATALAGSPADFVANGHGDPVAILAANGWAAHVLMDEPNPGVLAVALRFRTAGAPLEIHNLGSSPPLVARWFGVSDDELQADVRELLRSAPARNGSEAPKKAPRLVPLSEIAPERIDWLWPGRIARGKLNLIDGDPGLGKGMLCVDIAARVTTGRPWPDGAPCAIGSVVLLGAEDSLRDTIRPRLDAAQADVSRVHVPAPGHGDANWLPRLPDDIAKIEQYVRAASASVLIIDPLMAFLAQHVNAHRDQDVRSALSPLYEMADRTGVSVILVRHLNKSGGSNPLYRGGGSIGIAGAARLALLVALDPDDETADPRRRRRVLASIKQNLAEPPATLLFRVSGVEHPTVGSVGHVEWLGESRVSGYDVLGDSSDDSARSLVEEAADWLGGYLEAGPQRAKDVMRAGRDQFSLPTLRRARERLGVKSKREGFGPSGEWWWSLESPVDDGERNNRDKGDTD